MREVVRCHSLAMRGASGSRNVLIHQGSAKVITTRVQELPACVFAEFHPRQLDVVDEASVHNASNRVNQQGLSKGGTTSRLMLKVNR